MQDLQKNFILLSDGHLTSKQPKNRRDNITLASIEKLNFLTRIAETRNAIILQAGDFTHTSRDFTILLHIIREFTYKKIKIYFVKGEHDQYHRSNKASIMDILIEIGIGKLLNHEPKTIGKAHLYGAGHRESIPKPIDKKAINILVCHKSISDKPIYPGHKFTHNKNFLKKHEFDLVLCGHIHQTAVSSFNNKICINTGPLIRRSIDERRHKPCIFIFNPLSFAIDKIVIPHKRTAFFPYIKQQQRKEKMLKKFSIATQTSKIKSVNIFEVYKEFMALNKEHLEPVVINILERIIKEV